MKFDQFKKNHGILIGLMLNKEIILGTIDNFRVFNTFQVRTSYFSIFQVFFYVFQYSLMIFFLKALCILYFDCS